MRGLYQTIEQAEIALRAKDAEIDKWRADANQWEQTAAVHRAEIARLQEAVNYLEIADNHHQELMAEKEDEIARLQTALITVLSRLDDRTVNGRTPEEDAAVNQAQAALAKEGK